MTHQDGGRDVTKSRIESFHLWLRNTAFSEHFMTSQGCAKVRTLEAIFVASLIR